MDDIAERLAQTVREARLEADLTVAELADRSGVSKAMIGKVERGEAQPTAALLARLTGTLGLTLSQLIARAEQDGSRLLRKADQSQWTDPETGYVRRAVTAPGSAIEVVEVLMPAGAEVSYPAEAFFRQHVLWVRSGSLDVREGAQEHLLHAGDSLVLGPPSPCTYANTTTRPTRYAVILGGRR